MLFDFETLKIIWWAFLGMFIIMFAITGGFDLGVGMLLPFLGKDDEERRVIINAIGPTWEGNQVWFVQTGGALFAAWPLAYAVSFSGMYFAMLLALFTLFLRPLGFDYRSKLSHQKWRNSWDRVLFCSGFFPTLIFGIAFGNLLLGLPFHLDTDMRIIYQGSFWDLITPFSILAGLICVAMLVMHGAVYLQLKTEKEINLRAKKVIVFATISTLFFFAVAGYFVGVMDGYHISSQVLPNEVNNVLSKTVKRAPGLWFDNYGHYPDLRVLPVVVLISGIFTVVFSRYDRPGIAFIFSCFVIMGIILTAAGSMFPFLIPSSTEPNSSLTIWDSSSSISTLNLMFWVTVIFVPLITVYTSWVYRILRGKMTVEHIQKNSHTAY